MTQEQESHFNRLAEDIRDIKFAIMGNPISGDGGMVKRMTRMEERQEEFDNSLSNIIEIQNRWKWFAAIASGAATLVGWIVNLIWF